MQPEIQYQPVFYFSFTLKYCVNRLIGRLFGCIVARFFKETLGDFLIVNFALWGKI